MVLVFTELANCNHKEVNIPVKETTYIYTENSRSVNLAKKEKALVRRKHTKEKTNALTYLFYLYSHK